MAEPFTVAELAELRARYEQGHAFGTSLGTGLRLLATLDVEQARHEAKIDAVLALRSAGAVTLNRGRWRAFLAGHTTDGGLDPIGHAAYVLFAGLDADELERYYERHPDVRERHKERARLLLAELDERRGAAAGYPEGSKLRELAEEGLITQARRPDPEAIREMRAMVRAAAETSEEKP